MQIKYVNRALRRFDATQVIPTQFVMFTLSVIIGSAVLYRDFEKESASDAGKFVGGCAMTFLGVYFITSARNKDEDEDEVLEEDEEAIRLATEGVYHDEPEHQNDMRPDARRRSTAPLAHTISINGYKDAEPSSPPQSPHRSTLAENIPPQITRTSTNQTVSLIDGEASEPASFAEPSPLADNPWVAPEQQSSAARKSMQKLLRPLDKILPSSEPHQLPTTLKSTTSEPILPTEVTFQSDERPRTPPNASHDGHLPVIPHTPDGAHSQARHSISDFIPGPFTSTLSSPLSAIVADSLRRGVDIKSLRPGRRRKFPGMPRPGGALPQHRNSSEQDINDAPSSSIPAAEENGSVGRRTRLRSLSTTLTDLFKNKRVKRGSIDEAEQGRAGVEPDSVEGES